MLLYYLEQISILCINYYFLIIEAKTEFENLILNQKNWIFNEKYVCSNSSYVMTYMDVVQMGCFEDIDVKSTNVSDLINNNYVLYIYWVILHYLK